ncbi:hypothetical protein OEA41_000045 [Lepraria neglecta]|uniref:C2H2-type domain-containing protein n=1 Tax=Lepraria neglecta TaxID=209136 RepID=A0AAE0DR57_9LECA|nr:hypothetical protein OEA41_000045 [Lepraria neglecta]
MEDTSRRPNTDVSWLPQDGSISSFSSPIVSSTPQRRSFRKPQTSEVVLHKRQDSSNAGASVREEDVGISQTPSLLVAIEVLAHADENRIFNSLAILRSFSGEELGALLALQGYPDDTIRGWLQSARGQGNANVLQTRQAGHLAVAQPESHYASHPRSSTQQVSSQRSSTSSFGRQSSAGNRTTPYTKRGRRSRGRQAPSLPRGDSFNDRTPASSTNGDHVHWCTTCEQPHKIYTCDGYKRHEKEHETRFICMPFGPVEYENGSSYCTLCGIPNPNQRHLEGHKLGDCTQRPRTFTRKSPLVDHLKSHGIKAGEILAERWRRPTEKKAFACGFCVELFLTMVDWLNHIDDAHYKNHEHIRDWDANKVIEGLLRQSGVNESWGHILTSNPYVARSGFSWDQSIVKDLQARLEMAVEDPDILATAAFEFSVPYWEYQSTMNADTNYVDQDMDIDQSYNQHQEHDTRLMLYDPASTLGSVEQSQPQSAFQRSSHDLNDFSNYQLSTGHSHSELSSLVPHTDRDQIIADYLWSQTRPADHIDPGTRGTQPRPSFSRSLDSSSMISGRHHIPNSTQPLVNAGTDWHAGSVHNQSNEPSSIPSARFPSHPKIPRSDSYEPPSMQTLPPTIEEPEELFYPSIRRSTRKKSQSFFARTKKQVSRNNARAPVLTTWSPWTSTMTKQNIPLTRANTRVTTGVFTGVLRNVT